MDSNGITIRPATVEDIPDLIRMRRWMFESMGFVDKGQLAASDEACAVYLRQSIPDGQFRVWLAETASGRLVASGGVVIDRHPPGPGNLAGQIGYIMNMYTEPAFRRQGVAHRILGAIVAWLRAQGIVVSSLHATEIGRSLYARHGFQDSNEMRARL